MRDISRALLKHEIENKFSTGNKVVIPSREIVQVTTPALRGIYKSGDQNRMFNAMQAAQPLGKRSSGLIMTGKYSSGFDVPVNGRASINERIVKGEFSTSSHTLPANWEDFIDAIVIDLTMKKETQPSVRQFIYNMVDQPNATKIMRLQDMMPYAFQFKTNTGNGDPVPLGEIRGKVKDFVEFYIKATGFTYTLLASLFDMSLDMGRVNDGVNLSYNYQKDSDALLPIISYDYGVAGTAKHTAANAQADASSQLKTYLTYAQAIEDLSARKDSLFLNTIKANDLVLLCSSNDARHFRTIRGGFDSKGIADNKYPAIGEISTIVEYDGDFISFNDGKVLTFQGCTDRTAFLIKRNEFMNIYTKRGLTVEFDNNPSVLTLAQEEKAWYYSEAIYKEGINDYIQKISLPAWSL